VPAPEQEKMELVEGGKSYGKHKLKVRAYIKAKKLIRKAKKTFPSNRWVGRSVRSSLKQLHQKLQILDSSGCLMPALLQSAIGASQYNFPMLKYADVYIPLYIRVCTVLYTYL
jgi:hypothetical protein